MKVTVVQPRYYSGEKPDETIAQFLIDSLSDAPEGGLIVLPEYSNAGGISDPELEIAAMPRAEKMRAAAERAAKQNRAYVAVNVLEVRDGKRRNSTYLYTPSGEVGFVYDKQHLPPSEVALNVVPGCETGGCACVCEIDGIRFGFMTCYDVYFNEQIEYIAKFRPDIVVIPGYQRGERVDIIRAQAKLTAFRCNAFVARASYSMDDEAHGGCSMIVAPDGQILKDIGAGVGSLSCEIDHKEKYMRTAGFGGGQVRNDDFINAGLCPEAFR